jgi:membrane-bound serine protease (ClpP class)
MAWEWVIGLIVCGALLMAMDIYLPGLVLASIGVLLQLIGVALFARDAGGSQVAFLAAMVVALDLVIVFVSIKYFPKTRVGKKMILAHTQQTYQTATQESLQSFVGKECVTESPLRPTGTAMLDGRRVDVMTEGDFIPKGARVRIIGIREGHLLVNKLN